MGPALLACQQFKECSCHLRREPDQVTAEIKARVQNSVTQSPYVDVLTNTLWPGDAFGGLRTDVFCRARLRLVALTERHQLARAYIITRLHCDARAVAVRVTFLNCALCETLPTT